MKLLAKLCAALLSLSIIFSAVVGLWVLQEIKKPATYTEAKDILVTPGSTGRDVSNQLLEQNVLDETGQRLFYALLRINGSQIKAGEYTLPVGATMLEMVGILSSGKTVQRHVTVAEGMTVKQVIALLKENQYLTGDVTTQPEEGTLLPETYSFTRGDTRDSIIKRMQDAQKEVLDELWDKRDETLTLKTPQEAVILASIIEKETGKPEERGKIAGLFYNRLKIGMPLQSDPTVVYVITNKLGHMGGKPLYAKSLQIDSPYNTYKVTGLPPGPIANPGRASLLAALHPERHDFLYFVADGTGGHVFSETLKGHNENVTEWRKVKKRLNSKK